MDQGLKSCTNKCWRLGDFLYKVPSHDFIWSNSGFGLMLVLPDQLQRAFIAPNYRLSVISPKGHGRDLSIQTQKSNQISDRWTTAWLNEAEIYNWDARK